MGTTNVGDGFRYRHATGCSRIHHGHRGTLAHGHGFTQVLVKAGRGNRTIGHRHLPRAHHLVTVNQAGDRTVTDGDQETLGGHGGQAQHPLTGLFQINPFGGEGLTLEVFTVETALHLRWLAKQQIHGQIHRRLAEVLIADGQVFFVGCFAQHRVGRALTLADGIEAVDIRRHHRQHITLLGFVTPDLHRAHARLGIGDATQLQLSAHIVVVDQLGQRIGQAARPHVMDGHNRVVVTQGPAAINHFLHPTFDFRVIPLYRGEIQRFIRLAGRHGTGGTAPQTNQHGRATQHNNLGPFGNRVLFHMAVTDVAHAASDHDRLVVTADFIAIHPRGLDFQGTEIATQVGTTKFIIEGRPANWPFDHDIQRRGNPARLAIGLFPGLLETGNIQVRHGETGHTRLGLGTTTGGTFITDFTAGARSRPRVRGNRGGVVVGFHLHQQVHRLVDELVTGTVRGREETIGNRTGDHGSVVLVGTQHAFGGIVVGVADHPEQAQFLFLSVDGPVRIEDLVTTVLGIGLGEHHQLGIRRVTAQSGKTLYQIIDFVICQRQTQFAVGRGQRVTATTDHIHGAQLAGGMVGKQGFSIVQLRQYHFYHAVMQRRRQRRAVPFAGQTVFNAALDTLHLGQAGVVANIRGLGRPGRDRAGAWHHHETLAVHVILFQARAVLQQPFQHLLLSTVQWLVQCHKVNESG